MNFCDTYHACIVSYPRESSDASDSRSTGLSGDGGRVVEPFVTLGRIRCRALKLHRRKSYENEEAVLGSAHRKLNDKKTARTARVMDYEARSIPSPSIINMIMT
jgi:hypothetical protein